MTNSEQQFLWGAGEIGDAIGVTKRRAFFLLENNLIPCRKVGGRWVANRNDLMAFLRNEVTAGDAA